MAAGKSRTNQSHYGLYLKQLRQFYQKEQVKLYTNLILSFLTIIIFSVWAIRPTVQTIGSLVKEIKDHREVSRILGEKIDDLEAANEAYEKLTPDLVLFRQSLPTTPQAEIFLAQIEYLAKKNGCTLVTGSIQGFQIKGDFIDTEKKSTTTKKSPTDVPETIGDFQVTGEYDDLALFLVDLNRLRRITKVNSFSFQKSKDRDRLLLRLSLTAYYFPEKQDGKSG